MKKLNLQNKKPLRVQRETVRELQLSAAELRDVVGGTNSCVSRGGGTSLCIYCQN